ncbi:hypothetical protein JL107_14180 [Nakamurella flavida]|uniref:Uncharacterized protein n=1 Tax=Nakamurella flavida TaxID=363630 RepID=A0A938YRJ5_9ACTN|nr:hypothetical protein [Nakamurella flavida]MBM9477595.1 hypothetical protein [Nakamurella flavida]MDP9779143.1 hypothetical protein [Nakamurella flavida]
MTEPDLLDPPVSALRPTPHEHAWTTDSIHRVVAGWVLYVRCGCGARRVDTRAAPDAPPVAASRTVPARWAPSTT